MCVDYRSLNDVTIKNKDPLPCIEDVGGLRLPKVLKNVI
jgi:hypothetical protein